MFAHKKNLVYFPIIKLIEIIFDIQATFRRYACKIHYTTHERNKIFRKEYVTELFRIY